MYAETLMHALDGQIYDSPAVTHATVQTDPIMVFVRIPNHLFLLLILLACIFATALSTAVVMSVTVA